MNYKPKSSILVVFQLEQSITLIKMRWTPKILYQPNFRLKKNQVDVQSNCQNRNTRYCLHLSPNTVQIFVSCFTYVNIHGPYLRFSEQDEKLCIQATCRISVWTTSELENFIKFSNWVMMGFFIFLISFDGVRHERAVQTGFLAWLDTYSNLRRVSSILEDI